MEIDRWVFVNFGNPSYFDKEEEDWDLLFGVICGLRGIIRFLMKTMWIQRGY